MPRILFFGMEDWAARFLEYLLSHDLAPIAVVTKEDKPASRGLRSEQSAVKKSALTYSLSVLQPKSCSSEEFLAELRSLRLDLGICIAYGKILPQELLDIPLHGFINVHPSLLPLYRGPSPFAAPILHGDTESGITLIQMDEQMDHGPILSQEKIFLNSEETAQTLEEKVVAQGCSLLIQTIHAITKGTFTLTPQDHSRATYTKLMTRESGKIDWSKNVEEIERMVRALAPWPGTWCMLKEKRLTLLKSRVAHFDEKKNIGHFFIHSGKLFVQCGTGTLELLSLQLEGKRPLEAATFIHGYRRLLENNDQKKEG